jgi:hypothetical protein
VDFSYTPAEEAFRRERRGWLGDTLGEHRRQHPASDDELTLHPDLFSQRFGIAGGTDQIQRNIIAERMLGLPK